MTKIGKFPALTEGYTYQKMKFSNDSKGLILAFTKDNDLEVQVITIEHD